MGAGLRAAGESRPKRLQERIALIRIFCDRLRVSVTPGSLTPYKYDVSGKAFMVTCRAAAVVLLLASALSQIALARPLVGVQRWDMYAGQNMPTQQQELGYLPGAQGFLKPEEWHHRAPFFARRTVDVPGPHPPDAGPLWINYPFDSQFVQDTMDQEIDFAADAGIDYFIFNGPTRTLAANGWSLRDNLDAYLASPKRDRINFVSALYGHRGIDYGRTEVDLMLDELIPMMQLPVWQTVSGGRPLVPVLWPSRFEEMLGNKTGDEHMTLPEFVSHVRQRITSVGLPEPYLVGQHTSDPTPYADDWLAAGFDAMSAYAGAYGGALATSPDDAHIPTYAQATEAIFEKLDEDYVPGSLDFVPPIVDQHWPWPRQDGDNPVWSYRPPEPGDLSKRVKAAFDYIDANADDIEAETIFMYSWNEWSEGGGLGPTMGEAPHYEPVTAHLDELGAALRPVPDFNGDGAIDAADYTIWRDNRDVDTNGWKPRSLGDSDGDGIVNADDYDNWSSQFGGPGTPLPSPPNEAIVVSTVNPFGQTLGNGGADDGAVSTPGDDGFHTLTITAAGSSGAVGIDDSTQNGLTVKQHSSDAWLQDGEYFDVVLTLDGPHADAEAVMLVGGNFSWFNDSAASTPPFDNGEHLDLIADPDGAATLIGTVGPEDIDSFNGLAASIATSIVLPLGETIRFSIRNEDANGSGRFDWPENTWVIRELSFETIRLAPTGNSTQVPEPAAALMLAVACLCGSSMRHKRASPG